jgi:minor histocompatibility antigen H13
MATETPLSPMMEFLGKLAYGFTLVQPFLPTYVHLLVSALFPIYIGAHASLSRPDSAAKPDGRRRKEDDRDGTDDDDEDEEEQKMEGLSPGDAILFPLMAGTTMAGLYFLIKWLDDPALLNMIMNGYLSLMGIFSVGRLIGDSLNTTTSFIFPRAWKEGGNVIRVDKHEKGTYTVKDGWKLPRGPSSPLPGILSRINLSTKPRAILWTVRGLLTEHWTLTIRSHGKILNKTKFGLNDVIGMVSGALIVLAYNFISKTWWLTNLLGFGFSYIALQFMSPTTFWTGTLILSALFFYDIYFVFFT